MNRTTFILFLVIILAIAGGTVWYLVDTRQTSLERDMGEAAPEGAIEQGTALYSNGPYGFSLAYPEAADVSYDFPPSYHLGTTWRANALPDSVGVPIVSIVPYSTESDHSYPRYFSAMVRIGASTDPSELEACEKPTPDQGEVALPDVMIGGRTWKAFSFQNAGMMQYVSGVSYRTVHEGKCIALEKIRVGSSYRDDPVSPDDIPQERLDAEYESLSAIIESFSFARP